MKYYRQETPYTCGAACLRMILSEYKEFSEKIIAALSRTIYLGATPLDLANAAEELGYKVNIYKHENVSNLDKYVPAIVLINPGVIFGREPTKVGHFVVVKRVEGDKVIFNDPDPLFGGEDKEIDLDLFVKSWKIMRSWIIQVGEEKDGQSRN